MNSQTMSETVAEAANGDLARGEDGWTAIDTDDVFHVLQNGRRRSAIRYMMARPEQDSFEMRDIAEQITAWENDKPIRQISSTERQRVYIALYQSHLPKLEEKGLIEYDQSRGTVKPTALIEYVGEYLAMGSSDAAESGKSETSAGFQGPSSFRYYSGATLFGLLLICASWMGAMPAVLTSYLATFITGLFAVITVGTRYVERLSA